MEQPLGLPEDLFSCQESVFPEDLFLYNSSLEVEGGQEVLAGLAVGPQVHAADAQVVPAIAWMILGVP